MATTLSDITAAFRRAPHAFLDVGHSRLATWRFGAGPDLVFVHGWPLHAATFRGVVAELAGQFTCHLIDLPGAGATQIGAATPISLPDHARTVRAAVDALGLTRYALVAHDSGGFIARAVAADDPRVRGVVSGNTEIPGHTPFLILVYALLAWLPGGTALARTMMRSGILLRSPLLFGNCFADRRYVDGEFRALFVAPLLASRAAMAAQMKLVRTIDRATVAELATFHARMRAPTKLIWGTDDPFFPLARARAMLPQFAGGATLDELPGAKLFAHEDRAAEFAALARPFLAACFADAAARPAAQQRG